MSEQVSFKSRVLHVLINVAPIYEANFVNYDYLLCSEAFRNNPYYIVSAHGDNFKHLSGVQSHLSPSEFYQKAKCGTLSESDISFEKRGQQSSQIKGSVRRKTSVMMDAMHIFSGQSKVEEDFSKNQIKCSFAASKKSYTLGFTATYPVKPMTLLAGCELSPTKSGPLELVLRRPKGQAVFDEILVGDAILLAKYSGRIHGLLSDNLIAMLPVVDSE